MLQNFLVAMCQSLLQMEDLQLTGSYILRDVGLRQVRVSLLILVRSHTR